MARRRHQDPPPRPRGRYWVIRVRKDSFDEQGKHSRKQVEVKLGLLAEMGTIQAKRAAEDYVRPMNQGNDSVGGAVHFAQYVENYKRVHFPKLAKTSRESYGQIIRDYLQPAFGKMPLNDIDALTVDEFFAGFAASELMYETVEKIRTVLSSVMRQAQRHRRISQNPAQGIELPRLKRRPKSKPYLTPEQFNQLVARIPEPYATMVYVCAWAGLRVSELIALKWEDLRAWTAGANEYGEETMCYGLRVDERYCRGDLGETKTSESEATIEIPKFVYDRITRLKQITVEVRAGRGAIRKHNLVKSDGPSDWIFQSVWKGKPMNDGNILRRHIKPAARAIGLPWVNWSVLRRSCGTWMVESGANPKDVQARMRHSRIKTTMEIYAQFVTDSQRRALDRMAAMMEQRRTASEQMTLQIRRPN